MPRRAMALVPDDLRRAASGAPAPSAADATAGEQRLEVERLVALTPGEDERHRLAAALGAKVDLRGEPAARAAEGLIVLAADGAGGVRRYAPPCARTTVPST